MITLPPIDLHAHINPDIEPNELIQLQAVVFAATASLSESSEAGGRRDETTVWGVGCHPGLVRSQNSFDGEVFRRLIQTTAFVGEIGLDGDSRVPIDHQLRTLEQMLDVLSANPRLTSLHSYRATGILLRLLEEHQGAGRILHWWLGTAEETQRAVELGCYFSVNLSSVRREDVLQYIPLDRVLTETDHPAGDRFGGERARPGHVEPVERALSNHFGLPQGQMRAQIWHNFDRLVLEARVESRLPRKVRVRLASL